MTQALLHLGFVVIVLAASTGHSQAAAEHSPLTRSRSAALTELGRKLFFDVRFSQDGAVSCAFCHQPEKAFTDGRVVAQGVHGKQGTRNTPSLRNAVYTQAKFWDGRRADLHSQVLDPFLNAQDTGSTITLNSYRNCERAQTITSFGNARSVL